VSSTNFQQGSYWISGAAWLSLPFTTPSGHKRWQGCWPAHARLPWWGALSKNVGPPSMLGYQLRMLGTRTKIICMMLGWTLTTVSMPTFGWTLTTLTMPMYGWTLTTRKHLFFPMLVIESILVVQVPMWIDDRLFYWVCDDDVSLQRCVFLSRKVSQGTLRNLGTWRSNVRAQGFQHTTLAESSHIILSRGRHDSYTYIEAWYPLWVLDKMLQMGLDVFSLWD